MSFQVLFVHTNYPAQFRYIVKELINLKCDVWFASHTKRHEVLPEVHWLPIESVKPTKKHLASQLSSLSFFKELLVAKRQQGLNPEVIYVHTGWGLGTFLRDMFPKAKIVAYSEWWFNLHSEDFAFDVNNSHIDHSLETRLAMVLRNKDFSYELINSDAIIAPTVWQKSQLPSIFQKKCHVIFDGIDADFYKPGHPTIHEIDQLTDVPPSAKILTYATRGLEPYRGFPEFVSAAEYLLTHDESWHIVIAGQDKINYHKSKAAPHDGYGAHAMAHFLKLGFEDRVHMVGSLPLSKYLVLLQSSDLHCYFTRPYVLSWSLLESSLVGCNLFVSATAPVTEFLRPSPGIHLVDYTSSHLGERLLDVCLKTSKITIDKQKVNLDAREDILKLVERKRCVKSHLNLINSLLN